MTSRLVRPSRIPTEIPADVELFIASEIDRYQLVLDGVVPDTDKALDIIDSEYDRLAAEGITPEEVDGDALDVTVVASVIMRGMGRHALSVQTGEIPATPEERERHIASGLVYADIIRTGLHTMYWTAIWHQSRASTRELPVPPNPHRICESIASTLTLRLGGAPNALRLADRLQSSAQSLGHAG